LRWVGVGESRVPAIIDNRPRRSQRLRFAVAEHRTRIKSLRFPPNYQRPDAGGRWQRSRAMEGCLYYEVTPDGLNTCFFDRLPHAFAPLSAAAAVRHRPRALQLRDTAQFRRPERLCAVRCGRSLCVEPECPGVPVALGCRHKNQSALFTPPPNAGSGSRAAV